jgi:GTPase
VSGIVRKNNFLFLGPNRKAKFFEIRIKEIRIDDKEVPFATPGQMCTIFFSFSLDQENGR